MSGFRGITCLKFVMTVPIHILLINYSIQKSLIVLCEFNVFQKACVLGVGAEPPLSTDPCIPKCVLSSENNEYNLNSYG